MPAAPSSLAEYDKKRDFSKTKEPAPSALDERTGPLTFVIQKHAATAMHYDFRLEIDGVLKSWPIPRGPSYNPENKRLAVMTEDHPLDYASFEGLIPKGEYGGGEVIVWDAGIFAAEENGEPIWDREKSNEAARRGVERGRLTVFLQGHKMSGLWTLIKTSKDPKQWLFLKKADQYADAKRDVVKDEPASVLSGLTIEDLKNGKLPDKLHRPALLVDPAELAGSRQGKMPESVEPMIPTLTEKAFSHPDWVFEPKLDGYRMICVVQPGGGVRLFSRRGLEATKDYGWLVQELRQQPYDNLILDGEIVALDEHGRASFQRMQNARGDKSIPQQFFAFDILFRDGYDVRGCTFEDRRRLLEATVVQSPKVRVVDVFPEDGVSLFNAAKASGFEGVVGKKKDSKYETGRRSPQWLKVKTVESDEFVIGGFSKGTGARERTFGALIVGYYKPGAKKLTYVGHTGGGFDDKTLVALHKRLSEMATDESPFDAEVPMEGRWTKREKVQPTWVKPELVAEIKYTEQTDDGILRNPIFMRLREDKKPQDVRLAEIVAAPGAPPRPKKALDLPRAEEPAKAKAGANKAAEPEPKAAPPPSASDLGSEVKSVLDQLEGSKGHKQLLLEVEGYKISLTNLDKVMWPAWEDRRPLTKRDLAIYFAKAAPYLLPHLKDRPLTLVRFPNGIKGGSFYQKHYAQPQPPFVETVMLYSDHNAGDGQYILCNNLATLIWLGQIADLELHSWYSRVNPEPDGRGRPLSFAGSIENMKASILNYPDFVVFDLDPYIYSGLEAKGEEPEFHPKGFSATCETALWLKEVLDGMGLSSFVKTTGKTGLHIYVPILRTLDYSATHAISETISRFLVQAHPKEVTVDWTVANRPGKVFADYNQNVRGKTLASIYSPRVQPWAGVSMPVRWDELKSVMPPDFNLLSAPERLAEVGDLWAGILDAKHDLAGLLK